MLICSNVTARNHRVSIYDEMIKTRTRIYLPRCCLTQQLIKKAYNESALKNTVTSASKSEKLDEEEIFCSMNL